MDLEKANAAIKSLVEKAEAEYGKGDLPAARDLFVLAAKYKYELREACADESEKQKLTDQINQLLKLIDLLDSKIKLSNTNPAVALESQLARADNLLNEIRKFKTDFKLKK